MLSTMDVISEIVGKVGSQAQLASLCEVSPQAVSKWVTSKRIPTGQCRRIESATGIPSARIRPDIFGPIA